MRTAGALCALFIITTGCAIQPPNRDLALEWYGVGNAWLAAGKYAEAGKAYDRAISLDPKLVAASYNAARALVEAGSYDRGIGIAQVLAASEKDNVRYISLEAYAFWKAGRKEEAAAAWEKAWALDPWAPDVIFNSSLLLLDAGNPAAALERLAPLVTAKPDDEGVVALNARALTEAGREAEAILAWEDLRALGKIDAASLEKLGLLYEKAGEFAKGMEALAAAVEKEPKRGSAWFALARIRLSRADDAKAGLEALGKALEAGFSDRDAALALATLPGLVDRPAVVKALVGKGLVEDSGGEGPAPVLDTRPNRPAAEL
jgi:tetratricopeptide (TPR) repeat protein